MAHEEKIESKFICVWLDNQLMKSEDYVDTQDQLEILVKIFRIFRINTILTEVTRYFILFQ
jgi:hypothetical protein